ncbi:MAG: cytochrome c3 family protein [Desulfurivibrionaceae bacterium]
MLNKKLVLGSLAGATLLVGAMVLAPSSADAAVQGECVKCHTMHDSQGGLDQGVAGPQDQLLIGGCTGCHNDGEANGAGGVSGVSPNAPQVGAAADVTYNAAGYFSNTDSDSHTLLNVILGQPAPAMATGPGGTFASNTFGCTSCHGIAGHHGTADSYRMLSSSPTSVTVTATGAANYGNLDNNGMGTYDALSMNNFCADCHGDFHGHADAVTGQGLGSATGSGPWVRHPTDVTITGYAPAGFTGDAVVPVGTGGMVLCISCHRAHGSSSADLLRFSYNTITNAAGDAAADTGCESCHGAK